MIQKKSVIKLLFLLPTYTFGGAERTSLNLLNGIDKNRFRICLVTSKNIFQNFQHIDIEKFISIEDLGIGVWFNSFRRLMHDMKKVGSLLKTEKPDIAFGMMHYPSSLLVFAKKLYSLKVKVIVSPRGPSAEYLRYFEKRFSRKIYLKGIFSFFCKYADGLVVASHGMKEECIRHFYADPSRIIVIPNSVDSHDIRIKAEENVDIFIPDSFQIISTSGRLEREKNIPFLLKVFSTVRKKEKLKLVIIGDGTEKENLQRLADELGIGEDVIFIGYQKNPYKFIRRSDIFVHTCLFEGFANSIIEAMACGVPVITVDCPYGPKDIIKHGEDGYLVPINDEGLLVNAIIKLLNNKQLRDDISKRGYDRALNYSVDKMVRSYQNCFEGIFY